MKNQTTPKTIRIPNKTISEIENEASKKNTTFSEIAIRRLQHSDNALTPSILAKIQNVINTAMEGAKTGSVEMIEKAQKEGNDLWKRILM